MLRYAGASDPGSPGTPNEDWASVTSDLVVVLDGATARTETGCRHGAAWYAQKLGGAIIAAAEDKGHPLTAVLADAIRHVANLHPECDLTHPGSPSAGVAIVQLDSMTTRYLVLGDVTVVADVAGDGDVIAITDDRVSRTASDERAEADRYAIGTPEKNAAMIRMKHVELAAKNQPGGYWIAGADPAAVDHAITGQWHTEDVRRLAVLTDGAARAVEFGLTTWPAALNSIEHDGPDVLIRHVRDAEAADPIGATYPRNKRSDDATATFVIPNTSKERRVTERSTDMLTIFTEARGILGDGNPASELTRSFHAGRTARTIPPLRRTTRSDDRDMLTIFATSDEILGDGNPASPLTVAYRTRQSQYRS